MATKPHNDDALEHLHWFRNATPYIQAHRNKTLVIALGGETVQSSHFSQIIQDLLLLHSLGIRLIIVHGARPQINARLQQAGITSQFSENRRITNAESLPYVVQACGKVRHKIEAALSTGTSNRSQTQVTVFSGNMLTARPYGVREGTDYAYTGEVRKVNSAAINALLEMGGIVLLSHVGYSPTGEFFNCSWEEIAVNTAIACKADKLIVFSHAGGIRKDGVLIRELNTQEADQYLNTNALSDPQQASALKAALKACRNGVNRCHLLSHQEQGALLKELFTTTGSGTLLSQNDYEQLRPATIEDVGGIIALIGPLEEEGVLVRRSRERLETEIHRFFVTERDGIIIGCAALYPFDKQAELACVAVDPEYRHGQRGDALLRAVETAARAQGITSLFVLTTRTGQWFQERGFVSADVSILPQHKKSLYNLQRNSLVFNKTLV